MMYGADNIQEAFLNYPVMTANCLRSKDGVWFQLLGVETPRWLMPFSKAFGLKGKVLRKAVYHGVKDIAFGSGTFFEKAIHLFRPLNSLFQEKFASLTSDEIK